MDEFFQLLVGFDTEILIVECPRVGFAPLDVSAEAFCGAVDVWFPVEEFEELGVGDVEDEFFA